jgi:tRNA(Ile)-lysidine synthase
MKRYIAAVSGGPDSMALLNKFKKNIAVVCHINYNKRNSADRDMKIVKEYCKKNHITCEILNCDKQVYSKYKNVSNNFQTVARIIRYDFFLKVAKQNQIFDLYVAHNFNDFLETAFMQRKKNSKALFYGIKKNSAYGGVLKIHRPLIGVPKSKLEEYCLKSGVDFGIDESNFTNAYQRNITRKIINTYSPQNTKLFISGIKKYNRKNAMKLTKVNASYNS